MTSIQHDADFELQILLIGNPQCLFTKFKVESPFGYNILWLLWLRLCMIFYVFNFLPIYRPYSYIKNSELSTILVFFSSFPSQINPRSPRWYNIDWFKPVELLWALIVCSNNDVCVAQCSIWCTAEFHFCFNPSMICRPAHQSPCTLLYLLI